MSLFPALLVLGCVAMISARSSLSGASAGKNDTSAKIGALSGEVLMYTRTSTYLPQVWMNGEERFPRGGAIVLKTGNDSHLLVSDFAATIDPNLNSDGTSALFAGKRKQDDPWQIYEVPLNGGTPRQITSCEEDCIRPFYLPAARIVYARKAGHRYVLETAALDGSGPPLGLTYAPGNYLATDVLRDGRILFESGFPLGSDGYPEIYAVYPDGSGVESYRCDHRDARFGGVQGMSGDILFARARRLGKFTSALAHGVTLSVPERDYSGGIAEAEANALILSSRPIQAAAAHSHQRDYALDLWSPRTHALTAVAAQRGESLVEPVVVKPHPIANRFPSALHNWKTTNLLALNSYISRDGGIPQETLSVVRVSTLDASGKVQVLGTAPIEKDGSFFVQAPGDSPLKFELLNSEGNVVRKEHGWMWARRGEQRVCVGCHAGPERAPDNAVPAVLLRTTTPVDLTAASPDAARGAN